MRLNAILFAASLGGAIVAAPLPFASARAQSAPAGESVGEWMGRAAAQGVTTHSSARDFSRELADSGEFDAEMTEWLRRDSEYHQRMIEFNETMIEAAAAERGITDPKASAPSQALEQWIGEQTARRERDAQQAQRLEGDGGPAATQFQTIKLRNDIQAASEAQTIQRWTTVIVDSTGEVIVNDQADLDQIRFEELMRRHAFEVQAYKELIARQAEVIERLHGDLAGQIERQRAANPHLAAEFERARRELASMPGAPTGTSTDELFRNLSACAEEARIVFVAASRLSGEARAARERQADRLMARCEPIGEEINRRLGREELDRVQEAAAGMGLID